MKAVLILIVIAGCGWDFNRMNNQPRCEPGDRTTWLPDDRCDQDVPANTVAWHARLQDPPEPAATQVMIARGADRFARMCAPCHGQLGDGNSVIAKDMVLRPPPSLHTPLVRGYPDQHLYDVISHGYGMMPSYAWQLTPEDRWAVVHYVRVLERSQAATLQDLPPTHREEAARWLR